MKIKKFIFITFILWGCSINKDNKSDLTRENIEGQAKAVTTSEYEALEKFGEIQMGTEFRKNSSMYNEKGNIIEETYYEDGILEAKTTYKYDKKGNKIEFNQYDSDGSLVFKTTYKHDEKGNEKEKNDWNSDGSLDVKYIYKYNEKGNKIEECYDEDGVLLETSTFKYDEGGNETEHIEYDSKGSLLRKETCKYDKKGNRIEASDYDSDGSFIHKWTYEYNEKGNAIEKSYNHFGGSKSKYTYKHEEYDKNGNWLKQIYFVADKPTEIFKRKIEYY